MLEALLPATMVRYWVTDQTSIDVDVIEASWLVEDWMEELEDLSDSKRDREIAQRMASYLSGLPQAGHPHKFTRTDGVSFIIGLEANVEKVKKKLRDPQSSSQSTEKASFQTVRENLSTSGSSETKYCPTANLPPDSHQAPSQESESSS